jgi:hypothetical protein
MLEFDINVEKFLNNKLERSCDETSVAYFMDIVKEFIEGFK